MGAIMDFRIEDGEAILTDSSGGLIRLSLLEFAQLATNARRFYSQLASHHQKGGLAPLATINVVAGKVVLDAHKSSPVLVLRDENGDETGLILPLETAKGLNVDLSEAIATAAAATLANKRH